MASSEGEGGYDFDTLDEPVLTTIFRDVKMVAQKFLQVLLPHQKRVDVLRDWDMWGPLVLCMTLAFILRGNATEREAEWVFTGTFVIIWGGSGVVTINAQLLGGKLSFFQSVCVLGYCVLPMVVAALINTYVSMPYQVDFVVAAVALLWAIFAARGFLGDRHTAGRKWLALYPLVLFYIVLAWLVAVTQQNSSSTIDAVPGAAVAGSDPPLVPVVDSAPGLQASELVVAAVSSPVS